MRASDRSTIAVIISVMLACFTVIPLTQDASFVGFSWILIIAIGAASLGLRRAGLASAAVLIAQIVILLVYSLGLSLTLTNPATALGTRWFQHYPQLWAAGIEHMRTQASPMEPDDGVKLIFVTVIGLIMIMTDLLVSGVGRPAWAIAPPATLFLVPALGLGTDTGVMSFCYIAVGYLAILIAEGAGFANQRGPSQLLVTITNDAWFQRSSELSCWGLSCRPFPCQESVSATAPVATVRCS